MNRIIDSRQEKKKNHKHIKRTQHHKAVLHLTENKKEDQENA